MAKVRDYWSTTGRLRALPSGPLILAGFALASANLIGKSAGLVNQIVISRQFGAGIAMDAYFAVLAVPVFVSGLLSSCLVNTFVPIYLEQREIGGRDSANRLFRAVLTGTIVGSVVLSLLVVAFGQLVVRASAPGLSPAQLAVATSLVPWIYPILALNVVTSLVTAAINAEGQFGRPAYLAVIVPAVMTAATLLRGSSWGIEALAAGLLVGNGLQFAATLWIAQQRQIICSLTSRLDVPGVAKLLKSLPVLLSGVLIVQASPIIDQFVASWLPVGSISAINYSLKIIDVPVVILFMTASRVLLPEFSKHVATSDRDQLRRSVRNSVWVVGALSFVASIILIVFSHDIVRLIFQRGAFTVAAVDATAGALVGFSIGLVPMGVGFLIPRVFNALGQNSVLFKMAFVTLVANFALDVILSRYLLQTGIALSTSLTYTIATTGLLIVLNRRIGRVDYLPNPKLALRALRLLLVETGSVANSGMEG